MDGTYLHSDDPDIYFRPAGSGARGRQGFWRRQFCAPATEAQFRFDVAFGLVVPVLCFVFDPIVFHGWLRINGGVLGGLRLYVYGASAVEMATLACWLFVVAKFPAWSRPAGGVMLAGGIFSSLIGVTILPFSVFGILIGGIGLLGFIPFVTAVVYLRNGFRALRHNRSRAPVPGAALVAMVFGVAVALGLPAAGQAAATRAVNSAFADVLAGRELSPRRARALRVLYYVSGAGFDEAAREYKWTNSAERKERLAEAYAEITGDDISQRRLTWLDD